MVYGTKIKRPLDIIAQRPYCTIRRQPGDHDLSAVDPWLCVTAFRRLCRFVMIYVYNIADVRPRRIFCQGFFIMLSNFP